MYHILDPNQQNYGGHPGGPGGYPQPPPAGFAGYPPHPPQQPGYGYPPQPGQGYPYPQPQQGYNQPGYPPQSDFSPYSAGQTAHYGQDEDPEAKGFEFNDESIRKGFIRKVYSILMVIISIFVENIWRAIVGFRLI